MVLVWFIWLLPSLSEPRLLFLAELTVRSQGSLRLVFTFAVGIAVAPILFLLVLLFLSLQQQLLNFPLPSLLQLLGPSLLLSLFHMLLNFVVTVIVIAIVIAATVIKLPYCYGIWTA